MTSVEKAILVKYRLEKAQDTLNEVDVAMQNKLWNIAMNRLYYSCYYAVTGLLASVDISTKTHSGAIQMFSKNFVKKGIIEERFNKLTRSFLAFGKVVTMKIFATTRKMMLQSLFNLQENS